MKNIQPNHYFITAGFRCLLLFIVLLLCSSSSRTSAATSTSSSTTSITSDCSVATQEAVECITHHHSEESCNIKDIRSCEGCVSQYENLLQCVTTSQPPPIDTSISREDNDDELSLTQVIGPCHIQEIWVQSCIITNSCEGIVLCANDDDEDDDCYCHDGTTCPLCSETFITLNVCNERENVVAASPDKEGCTNYQSCSSCPILLATDNVPSSFPSFMVSEDPSVFPSVSTSSEPSSFPSVSTHDPSAFPSWTPSSDDPSAFPSVSTSNEPSSSPSVLPTIVEPSSSPSVSTNDPSSPPSSVTSVSDEPTVLVEITEEPTDDVLIPSSFRGSSSTSDAAAVYKDHFFALLVASAVVVICFH